jgi:Insertion element 4 transposase N-terminal
VAQQLELCLDGQPLPAPSASVQARQRLGDEPLAQLFSLLAQAWSRTQRSPAPSEATPEGGQELSTQIPDEKNASQA